MNLRHAAGLALVGWYLMVPPVDRPIWYRVTGGPTPVSYWVTVQTYGKLDDCDLHKSRVQAHELYLHVFGRWTLPEVGVTGDAAAELERQALDPLWAWSTSLDNKNKLIEATPFSDRAKIAEQLRSASCVASDDPRLAK
jgi:hypothetical protein